jgi:hypothetical protein
VRGCEVQRINLIGAGSILIEDTTIHAMHLNAAIRLREDYGSSWEGDVTFRRVKLITRDETSFGLFVSQWYPNHNFGYQTTMPHTVTIEDLEIVSLNNINWIYLVYGNILTERAENISSPVASDGSENKHPYKVTERIIIKSNKYKVKFVLPDNPAFYDTMIRCDEGACFDSNWDNLCENCGYVISH